jgi:hypothetical protein
MAKPACFASLHHKKPGEMGAVKDLLKYLQHRPGSARREAYLSGEYKTWQDIPESIKDQALDAQKKWTDRGLGSDRKEIQENLENWQGRNILMRYWVIAPDPHLMQHVPEDKRLEMVARITDATMHDLYEANGWGTPQYSHVIHDKYIVDKRGVEFGEDKLPSKSQRQRLLPMPHAHVITPGTIDLGPHGRIDHYVTRPHLRNFRDITRYRFERELENELGKEKAQELITERSDELALKRNGKMWMHQRLEKGRAYMDVSQLLKAEEERKKDEKEKRKKHRERLNAVHMRAYFHRIREEQRSQRQQEYLARAYDDERSHITRLAELGQEQAERVQEIIDKDKYIPTHKERQQRLEFKEQRQHIERMHQLGEDFEASPEMEKAIIAVLQAQRHAREERERGGPER